MFESLSTRLQDVFKTLRGDTRLTPETIEAALRTGLDTLINLVPKPSPA